MRPLSGHSQAFAAFSTYRNCHGALYVQQATGNLEQDIAQLHTVAMSLTHLEVHDGQFSS